MRLGAPIYQNYDSPETWAEVVKSLGYRAAYCPVNATADDTEVRAYAEIAAQADIVIAEVGAWSNPLASDENTRREAIEKCQQSLDLADRIGANCCVNIAGSRGEVWDGHDPQNLTDDTFAMIVDTVRAIIDAVQPRRSFYTLEPMPWMYPDSPDSYVRLIQAIDRDAFGVHLDPVNWIISPQHYYGNAALIRETFEKLGPYIKSCHAKDIVLRQTLTVHLDEVRPGLGYLDYPTYLRQIEALNGNIPLMIEHLPTAEDYRLAAQYIFEVAEKEA